VAKRERIQSHEGVVGTIRSRHLKTWVFVSENVKKEGVHQGKAKIHRSQVKVDGKKKKSRVSGKKKGLYIRHPARTGKKPARDTR